MAEQLVPDGARALRAYLEKNNISVPTFCEQAGLDRIQVQKALNGVTQRISVDLATSIERATNGVILASSWRSDTRRMSTVGRLRRGASADGSDDADTLDGITVEKGQVA